jgi:hypothetical protein
LTSHEPGSFSSYPADHCGCSGFARVGSALAPNLYVKIPKTRATRISVQGLGYSVHFCRLDLVMGVRPGAVGVVGGELEG